MGIENLFTYICENADSAYWIIFALLMLAGLNIPISEDILLLTGGALASTCVPEHALKLYIWIYLGCWLSAWEAYWIGRLLGPKLYQIRLFHHIINPSRVERLHYYYEKFGVFTFIVGRFVPGGVRNALFISSGLGKMPFLTFILRDGLACLISSLTIFSLGYKFAENHDVIIATVRKYDLYAIMVVAFIFITAISIILYRHSKKAS